MTWWVIGVKEATISGDASSAPYVATVLQSSGRPSGSARIVIGGPYSTQGAAQSEADSYNKDHAAAQNAAANEKLSNNPQSVNPLTGLAAIGQFFNNLGQRNTWLRVFKVIAGISLIIAGVIHLTGAGKLVEGTAGAAAKGAIL
jgi:hypothetical protein